MAKYIEDTSSYTLFVNGSLESLLPQNSLARTIWAAVSSMDFSAFDAKYANDGCGRPAIDPRRLAGVWILALVRRESSSVALERMCAMDIEMRWLLGGAQVKKSTLSDFRTRHIDELSGLSAQVLAALEACDMLPGQGYGIDGTMVRAASSRESNYKLKELKKKLDKLEEEIRQKLSEPEADEKDLEPVLKKRNKFGEALDMMQSLGLCNDAHMTITEPEAKLRKLKEGGYAPAHNIQFSVDLGTGAIMNAEVIDQGNDQGQLERQLRGANEKLEEVRELNDSNQGSSIEGVAADSAYHDTLQLLDIEASNIKTFVPEGQQGRRPTGVSDGFLARNFRYDEENDRMVCPKGRVMTPLKMNPGKTAVAYRAKANDCLNCPHKHECCPSAKKGRMINRPIYAKELKRIAERVASEEGKRWMAARSVAVEGAISRLKELTGWRRCRTWGKAGAQAEAYWRQLTHNIMLLTGVWKPLVLKKGIA